MSFQVSTYNPSLVVLAFGGYPLAGWNTISITKNQPAYTQVRGIRGKNTRTRNPDTSCTITFSCLQTSEANDLLSQIHAQDIVLGTGRISLTLKDLSGSSIFSSSEAYITDYPSVTYSAGFEYRVWNIVADSSEGWNVGGNLSPQDSLFNQAVQKIGSSL